MASQPNSPSKGTRKPGATRQALIDAATSLFAQRGFEGTRVDQIAETAGVNKAMISYYFGEHYAIGAGLDDSELVLQGKYFINDKVSQLPIKQLHFITKGVLPF